MVGRQRLQLRWRERLRQWLWWGLRRQLEINV